VSVLRLLLLYPIIIGGLGYARDNNKEIWMISSVEEREKRKRWNARGKISTKRAKTSS
jgi:hypothetical protein